jgi:hypothetical protein
MSIANNRQVITKVLASAAVLLGFCVWGAAPAGAAPSQAGTEPNPFSTLSCSCRAAAPAGGAPLKDQIDRGIAAGRDGGLAGMPAPTHPGQPRP